MLTVVTGPPCSGKSTYVREHAKPGDIVIDFDVLARALGSPTPYDPPAPILWTAMAARNAAVNAAIRQHQRGATAWIIHTRIPHGDRERYERDGAHIVTLNADPQVLHARADEGRPAIWHQLIDQWTPDAPPRPAAVRVAAPPDNRRKGRPYRRWRTAVLARSTICWICGHDGADSADHLVPLARGGALLDPDNGAPAHHAPCPTCSRRCNTARGDGTRTATNHAASSASAAHAGPAPTPIAAPTW